MVFSFVSSTCHKWGWAGFECWNIGGKAMSNESDKPEGWLDFKEVKAKASMPVVLKYLKLSEHLSFPSREGQGGLVPCERVEKSLSLLRL